MRNLDNRTLGLIVLLGVIGLLILRPDSLVYSLDVILRVVFIILGIVATLYLWKRL